MEFISLSGKKKNVNILPYKIDWERKVSGPQYRCKQFLYPLWKSHLVLEEFVIPSTRMRIDLVNITRRIVIEVSPAQHFEFNPFFHQNKMNFYNAMKRDVDKKQWAELNGFSYVEVLDEDLDVLSKKWFKDKYQIEI